MKKAVRSSTGSSHQAIQAPSGTVNTVAGKLEAKPQPSAASPTPGWTHYVDSRLKQFCMR